jgi:hypothetical protein
MHTDPTDKPLAIVKGASFRLAWTSLASAPMRHGSLAKPGSGDED